MNNDLGIQHETEISRGERFGLGKTETVLSSVGVAEIESAKCTLVESMGLEDLNGMTFLDAGSGSGLFSLAAYKLGARVYSFDYDPQSVECTKVLREEYCDNYENWTISHGSVLDEKFKRAWALRHSI